MSASDPVVVFSPADFKAAYPEFGALTDPQLANYFDLSDAYFVNNTSNPAFCSGVPRMTRLAYMVTAHIAFLMAPRDASGAISATGSLTPRPVGQITSASEGSVSVSNADVAKGGSTSEAFFAQSQYGLMYWQATLQFRQAHYLPNPTIVGSPLFPMRYGAGRNGFR